MHVVNKHFSKARKYNLNVEKIKQYSLLSMLAGAILIGLLIQFWVIKPISNQHQVVMNHTIAESYASILEPHFLSYSNKIQSNINNFINQQRIEHSQTINTQDLNAKLVNFIAKDPDIKNNLILEAKVFTDPKELDNLLTSEESMQANYFGFAALEMAQNKFKGVNVLPEIHTIKQGQKIVIYVFALKSIDGVVLVAQDANAIQNILNQVSANKTQLNLIQSIPGLASQVVIQTPGNVSSKGALAPIDNSNWQVQASVSDNVFTDFSMGLKLWSIITVCIASLILLQIKFWSKLGLAIRNDVKNLYYAIKSFAEGHPYSVPLFAIKEFMQHDWSQENLTANKPKKSLKIDSKQQAILRQSPKPVKIESNLKNIKNDQHMVANKEPNLDKNTQQSIVSPEIFRACDIRGIVGKNLDENVAFLIGKSFAKYATEHNQTKVTVGRDGRLSGPILARALINGLKEGGLDVYDVGQVPTPVTYFSTHHLKTNTCVMLTGSHNPKDYNGFKMVVNNITLANESIKQLHANIEQKDLLEDSSKTGNVEYLNIIDDYINQIVSNVSIAKKLKIVIDCGNGVMGVLAEKLYKALGCDVVSLYCEVDGNFPNHHPDPGKPENLQELCELVVKENADIGLAFDGDGDRLGVVTNEGKIIWPDRLMMLFVKQILSDKPATQILFDVKCTKNLAEYITQQGGTPVMCQTGHALIKQKMHETGALFAGEMSGHFFFKDRWYGFDDGAYSGARLLEILASSNQTCAQLLAELPDSVNTPEINIKVQEQAKFDIVTKLIELAKDKFKEANLITIDGLRAEFTNGWGLVRASNTTANLVCRFEANSQEDLQSIKHKFWELLHEIDNNLELP